MIKNRTSKGNLSRKQLKAIEALLSMDSVDEAARTLDISRTTLYRYMQDPDFDNELRRAKRQLVNRAVLRLQKSCKYAAQALADVCRDKDAPPSSRVSAAREILSNSLKAIEIEDIEDRIKAIEEKLSVN